MTHDRPFLTFQRENRADVLPELKALFAHHWQEVARNKDLFALEPDDEFYEGMEKIGKLRVYTMRDATRYAYEDGESCLKPPYPGELVGYAVFFVARHPHYKSMLCAVSDIFWTKPKVRATRGWFSRMARRLKYWINPRLLRNSPGIRFFDFIESQLRAEGVNLMHTTYKVAHPAPGRVLRYLGHVHAENAFQKVLN